MNMDEVDRCDPDQYFDKPPGARIIRIDRLVRDHIPSQAKLAEAVYRMEKAGKGEYPKRKPISIRKLDNGKYHVVDGNTTTTAMMEWGCEQIIALEID